VRIAKGNARKPIIMDQESNQMEQHPVQCRNGCGFYSNAGTDGLCSVCYKDMIKKKQQPPTNMPASLAPSHAAMAQSPTSSSNINSSPEPVVGASCSSAGSINSSPIKPAQSWETASPTVQLPHTDKSELGVDSGLDCASADAAAATAAANATDSPGASAEDSGIKDSGKKKKNRCLECKKKVGLTGFTCRCGGLYCSIHRYSDKHECDFDYKEADAAEIRKSNPVVVAKKVQQI